MFPGWVGGGGGVRVPAWPPSPESCIRFRKLLPLISSPSDAAKPRFLVKVIEMERNCLNAHRNFSLRGQRMLSMTQIPGLLKVLT